MGHCLACGAAALEGVLDLGVQPLANALLARGDEGFEEYPLGVVACGACGHCQLTHFVPPEVLFRHYLYESGTSRTLGLYFDWFTAGLGAYAGPGDAVLEIASNDGSLLERMERAGYATLGVDPAENVVATAREKGLDVLCTFWPCAEALGGRRFKVVVAQNVFAHNPDPLAFLVGVREALEEDGVCLIQTSQANMIANGEFDTIYHEHYSFFTVGSMAALAARAGLVLVGCRHVDIHGTSFLFTLTKGRAAVAGAFSSAPFGLGAVSLDGGAPTLGMAEYQRFAEVARERMARVAGIVAEARAAGRTICFVGAAAKALTFVQAAGIVPDRVYDEAAMKIGRFIPRLGVRIEALGEIASVRGGLLVVISAWNFREELARKVVALRAGQASQFLVYFPEIEAFGG